jgi:transketolase
MRTGRSKCAVVYPDGAEFTIGKANQLRDGKDLTIIACGLMVAAALEAAHDLEAEGIQARVLDMHTVKPLDEESIERAARETGAIVTAEEHVLEGGLGAGVARVVTARFAVPMGYVGINNTYAESGDPEQLFEKYGLMPADIVRVAKETVKKKSTNLH